jgi:N-acetylglucosaminyl-diphospho-decaprenol L-rhamnosyltransferase
MSRTESISPAIGAAAPQAQPMVVAPTLWVSVISHGHHALLGGLLAELARQRGVTVVGVLVTLNAGEQWHVPEALGPWGRRVHVLTPERPRGFGANHNAAIDFGLGEHATDCVAVLNPDVRLPTMDTLAHLAHAALRPAVGAAYPRQIDAEGGTQDHERRWPGPWSLALRHLLPTLDQGSTDVAHEHLVDWVNAACLVLPTRVWQTLKGFDERYYMYCEDVDLCARMRLHGLTLSSADTEVVHGAERASRRHWRHLSWHVLSLMRLWASPSYKQARQLPALRQQRANPAADARRAA